MKIAIELSNRDYKMIKNGNGMNIDTMYAAIQNSTPLPKGHRVSGDLLGGLYCSECMTCLKDYFKYCPNCGAKMAETEDA